MLKRLLLHLYDFLAFAVMATLVSSAFARPAYAYIDPSVMTYTIQAVAGVAVALSAVAGVVLRRGRKVLMNVLDIDENARREIEPAVHKYVVGELVAADAVVAVTASESDKADATIAAAVSEPAAAVVDAASEPDTADTGGEAQDAPATKPSKKRLFGPFDERPYAPTWKERVLYGLIASTFLFFTVFVVAPYEVVSGALGSLVYTLADLWWVVIPPTLAAIAVVTLVLTLLRGKAFNFALVLVATLGLCAYVQALALNVGLPVADGGTIMWADHMVMQVVSTVVWVFLLVAALGLSALNRKRAQGVVAVGSSFLIVVQLVGVLSLFIAPPQPSAQGAGGLDALNTDLIQKTEVVMTEDQLYTVNPNANVIVFVLDTYDTAYLARNLAMNPHLLDGFVGFTNYENCTGGMIPTRFSIPQMLTGEMPRDGEPYSQFKAERYARGQFLPAIYDANYSIGLYTDSLTIGSLPEEDQRAVTDLTVNMHPLPADTMSYEGALEAMWYMAMYRDVPWPLKWMFWYYTDEINAMLVVYDEHADPDEVVYVMDDIRYYNRLCSIGLSFEEGDYAGGFRFIHLLGAHYPFSYDEQVNDLGTDNSNVFKQSQGALYIVLEYCDQLKKLGVYDQTTIIITADHGYWTLTMDPIEETSTPIMFVKPAQSAELDAKPMVTDEKPVSLFDLQATVLDAMGLDYSYYTNKEEYEGYSMLRPIDPNRVRLYVTTDSEGLQEMYFREYVIVGNALDWDNWSETGRMWDANA